ncbi:hypothetical protein K3495_g10030 [Podosphaera aphanis]|nr:hypothetical protein K3495_g10030 [Podosphaera aphanis]
MTEKWIDFPSFISEFERLADQGELSSSLRVYHLRRKVSEPLRMAAKNHIPLPSEEDISAWIEIFSQFWKNQESNRHIENSSFGYSSGGGNSFKSYNNEVAATDYPMDLDQMQLSKVTVTPAEWQFRRDHGLCNRCGGLGHYSRDCISELTKKVIEVMIPLIASWRQQIYSQKL